MNTNVNKNDRREERVKTVLCYVKMFIISVIITFSLFLFVTPGIVSGTSMQPNFFAGDRFFIVKDWLIEEYEYGDVVCVNAKDKMIIKRIIGLPGDRIEIKNGSVYRNGELIDESKYLPNGTKTLCECEYPDVFEIGEGQYFVLGDNREVSLDSRRIGTVSNIVGKAKFLYCRSWFT